MASFRKGKSVKEIQHNFAEFLGVSDANASLTKSKMDHIILENLGSSVNDAVMASIFNECDADGSGEVTIQEFDAYLQIIPDKISRSHRLYFVLRRLLLSRVFWPAMFFILGGALGIFSNILSRTSYTHHIRANVFGIGMIFFTIGCYVFVALDYEAVYNDIKLHDRVNAKIVTWALNKQSEEVHEMSMVEFNQLLQADNVFLPCRTVEEIFDTIDEDHSNKLTLAEIKEYASHHETKGKVTEMSVHARAISRCLCFRFTYWLNWGWVIGCAMFAIGAYISDGTAIYHLFGIGSIAFILLSLGGYYGMFYAAKDKVDNIHERIESLEALVQRFCRDERAKENKPLEGDLTEEEIQFAAEKLFASFDSGEGDGKLDFLEFNDALTQVGFVTALPVIKFIFNSADSSKDGSIEAQEFIVFILEHSKPQTTREYYSEIVWHMRRSWFFYIYAAQAFASVLFVVSSYVSEGGSDWALPGSLIFLLSGVYFVYTIIDGLLSEYNTLAHSKINFKKHFLAAVEKRTKYLDKTGEISEDEMVVEVP